MKFRFQTSSKAKNTLIPSPTTEDGSKEETFFDSQAWLDSDCDDDYLSVNGDFTPSRDSTSSNKSSYAGNSQLNKSQFMHTTPNFDTESSQSSPSDKKKKLSELLQENTGGDDVNDSELKISKPDNLVKPSKSTNGFTNIFPHLSKSNSVRSSDITPNRNPKFERQKSTKTAPCCLPILITSLSFTQRKRRPIPDLSAGG